MDNTLSSREIRVLGVLAEKESTTPDHYPLTLNSLTTGCNQKTSRDPVMELSEEEVERIITTLHGKHLLFRISGGTSRVVKYDHNLRSAWNLTDAECAVVAVLFLRGPQTLGEIKNRAGRMHPFSSLQEVDATLTALMCRSEFPLVQKLPREPGSREPRFTHRFDTAPAAEPVSEMTPPFQTAPPPDDTVPLREEVARLSARLEKLERAFNDLSSRLP